MEKSNFFIKEGEITVENEWVLNIPKILHIYWGGGKLPYLRYLTVKTFMEHNPDWEVMFCYPKYPVSQVSWVSYENRQPVLLVKDFLPTLMSLPIQKTEIDFSEYGISNSICEVHKSDFIRLIQLSKYGGLWSDMDIIYIKPMNDFYLNNNNNKEIETYVCNNNYGHSIGFMMGSKENNFFSKLLELAKESYNPRYYQIIGATLYNHHFPTIEDINKLTPAINIDMSVVYPYVAGLEHKLFEREKLEITDKTIGVHWFAGHPLWNKFLIPTNGGLENLPDCIISDLIKTQHHANKLSTKYDSIKLDI